MAQDRVPATGTVYQLRVVLAMISPLVWRRLLVPAETSVAGLHEILQTAFGWSDEHLHRFTIHAVEYGSRVGRLQPQRPPGPPQRVRPARGRAVHLRVRLHRQVAARYPGGGNDFSQKGCP